MFYYILDLYQTKGCWGQNDDTQFRLPSGLRAADQGIFSSYYLDDGEDSPKYFQCIEKQMFSEPKGCQPLRELPTLKI